MRRCSAEVEAVDIEEFGVTVFRCYDPRPDSSGVRGLGMMDTAEFDAFFTEVFPVFEIEGDDPPAASITTGAVDDGELF